MHPAVYGWPAYGVCLALALVAGTVASWIGASRIGLSIARVALAQLGLVLIGFVGARVYWLAQIGSLLTPGSVPMTLAGLRYPGGLLAVALALPLFARALRVRVADLGDALAPAVALAMAVMRLGCLMQGCCYGVVSALPWALRFPADSFAWHEHLDAGLITSAAPRSLPVHPLQVYFGVWSLAVAVILYRRQRRRAYAGELVLLLLALHEGGKGLLESLRAPYRPDLQAISLAVALGATALWLVRRRRQWPRPLRGLDTVPAA